MLRFESLNAGNWPAFELLFGEKGACGGCWCMLWRMGNKEFEKNKGKGNKSKMHQLTTQKEYLGILAFDQDDPVGWCSVSPKEKFIRLQNSRLFKSQHPDQNLWSITCLLVRKEYRMKGISSQLINQASHFAFSNGATAVEAYPIISDRKNIPAAFAWIGLASAYAKVGFKKVGQPSDTRLIMRKKKSGYKTKPVS